MLYEVITALRDGEIDYLLGEATAQMEAGADVLDVNVGLPELDEPSVLKTVAEGKSFYLGVITSYSIHYTKLYDVEITEGKAMYGYHTLPINLQCRF